MSSRIYKTWPPSELVIRSSSEEPIEEPKLTIINEYVVRKRNPVQKIIKFPIVPPSPF